MKKYVPLLAFALTALTPSVHAVDTTKTNKYFNNPAFQKRYLESDVLTKMALHPYTYSHRDSLLSFAFKCSLLPKDSPLKGEERPDVLSQIEEYDHPAFLKNRQWFEDCLNKLDNLETKDIINHIVSADGFQTLIDKIEVAYELAKDLIPWALHRKKTEEARYFYQQITQRVPEESMRKMELADTVRNLKDFQAANILKAQFIKNAAQYDNADAIIQTLLGEPYQIKQDDMDCAFWLGFFCPYSPWVKVSLNDFFRLFSNPNIKPSLEIVKKTLRAGSRYGRYGRYGSKEESLAIDFLRFFIGCQSTDAEQEQSHFNLKGDLKKLRDNVGQYPELGKALENIQADFKNRKILEGGDPWTDRVISHEHNIKLGNTGEMVARLSKNQPVFKLKGRTLPAGIVDDIMTFADPTASKLIHLPGNVVRRIEENEGRKAKQKEIDKKRELNNKKSNEQWIAQKEAEEKIKTQIDSGNNDNTDQHIETVVPNSDTAKIDNDEIDTVQKSKDHLEESKDSGEF